MSLKNKVALVTGGSSGIGAAVAILFTKEQANVAIIGRNETKLNNTASKCEKLGKKPLILIADVADDDQVKLAIEKTVAKFGKLDILVNNAGSAAPGSLLEGNALEAYDKTMAINTRAVVAVTRYATPHLSKTKGNIINISSICATIVLPGSALMAYTVSKAAVEHFSRAAAVELASVGIRVNIVSPGPVKTDFEIDIEAFKKSTLLNRCAEAEEIADVALFLVSDKAKGITGATFVVDNGMTIKR